MPLISRKGLEISDILDKLDSDKFVGKLPNSVHHELLDSGESSDTELNDQEGDGLLLDIGNK
jgi:uncharacterized protein YbcI